MRQKLLFGTAYYAEYMPYDRVETDLDLMKDAGMNVIRIAESTWSVLEKTEGDFDFSYIDRVLEEAKRRDMQVIIGTPTYAVPAWLMRKEPDVMVTTKEGRASYGHRQLINIMNPVYLSCAEKMLRALLSHTANRKCVIGFQIDNETKHYENYGSQAQELFKEHLIRKFKTVENFNKAFYLHFWSNSIADWDDLPDMKGCCNGGLAGEYAAFMRQLAVEFLYWQAAIVKEYKREGQFITHNLDLSWKKFGAAIAQDGHSYGVQPDICHYEAAKCLTLAGTDIYHPTKDRLTGAEIAFGGDEMRTLKDSAYLVLEAQAQGFKYWTPYPGQLRLHAYSHLAGGACGMLYWNWHSIHNGYETYWRGILGHDLQINPAYREMQKVGKEWNRIGEQAALYRKENRIALLIDNRSLDALNWFPVDKDLCYNDIVRWMYDCLYELNLECDILYSSAVTGGPKDVLNRYRMVVTPALYSVSLSLLECLDEYVKNGGVLVSSFRSFVADEHFSIYPDTQPYLLHSCFGMRYQQFTEPGDARIMGRKVSYYAELLETDTAVSIASYEHKYWNAYAGITRNDYGQGAAYYIGCYTEKETLKELYQMAADDAGISREIEALWPVIVRSGKNAHGNRVHYLLHYDDGERSVLCPWERAYDILTGEAYQKGEKISLDTWGVKILEER